MTAANETTQDIENLEEARPDGLPLKGQKNIPLKLYGVLALLGFVVLVNFFIMPSSRQHASSKGASENFSLKAMEPTQGARSEHGGNQPSTIKLNQDAMRQRIEEAKAKDFINRLQAGQSLSSTNHQEMNGLGAARSAGKYNAAGGASSQSVSSDPNTAFLDNASDKQPGRAYAQRFGLQPYMIGQGKFIFATLAVAINSDLAGQLTAIVSQNVYGEKGRYVLIPRGSRLIGEYRSGLSNNQSRLFVVWTRVILPNGLSVMLGSEGTDALGQAGLTGRVNYHFFARFGTASLLSLIGAGVSTVGVNPGDEYNSMAAYRQAVSQSLSKQASDTLSGNVHIPPTVHVKQGSRIVVFVNKDLDFSRAYR